MQKPQGTKVVELSALRRRRPERKGKQGLANAAEPEARVEFNRKEKGKVSYLLPSLSDLIRRGECGCDHGALCWVYRLGHGKCQHCGRATRYLVHCDDKTMDEPYIVRDENPMSVLDLLDLLGDSDISYSWVREAPFLFQLSAICFACVRAGKRIERCKDNLEGFGCHDYRDRDGKDICFDCGDDADHPRGAEAA